MSEFFIADMHFGSPYRSYAKPRGFKTVEAMDEAIASAWRARVTDGDTVWILGEVGKLETLAKLPGSKHLIFGNDDSPRTCFKDERVFASWATRRVISARDATIELVHIPSAAKLTEPRVLHGHTHAQPDEADPRFVSVSVDKTGWGPIGLDEVLRRFADRRAAA